MGALLLALLLALPSDPLELVRLLGDPSLETREQAQQALEDQGEKAEPALEEGTKSADPEVAARAKAVLEAGKAQRKAILELQVLPASASVKPGEELRYSIRVRNVGKTAALLLRPTPGSRNSLKPPKLVSEFKNSPGLTLKAGARPPAPPPPCPTEKGDFLELKPGESAELIAEKDCVGLTPSIPGRFSIAVVYTLAGPFDCTDDETLALSNRLLLGEFRSKPVEVEVKE